MKEKCIPCLVNTACKCLDAARIEDENERFERLRKVFAYISEMDLGKSASEAVRDVEGIVTDQNPFGDIKAFYNREVMKMTDGLGIDTFEDAMKVAIIGNLIDYGTKELEFSPEILRQKMRDMPPLAIDDSQELKTKLEKARTVLYIGDNCGEIALDKVFIEYIGKTFAPEELFFAVRGAAAINDVTMEDADLVGMHDVAKVVSNGDNTPSTIIERVSDEFRDLFFKADVVIAKGLANFEDLSGVSRDIFHLLMSKCDVISEWLEVPKMSIVCVVNRNC